MKVYDLEEEKIKIEVCYSTRVDIQTGKCKIQKIYIQKKKFNQIHSFIIRPSPHLYFYLFYFSLSLFHDDQGNLKVTSR